MDAFVNKNHISQQLNSHAVQQQASGTQYKTHMSSSQQRRFRHVQIGTEWGVARRRRLRSYVPYRPSDSRHPPSRLATAGLVTINETTALH